MNQEFNTRLRKDLIRDEDLKRFAYRCTSGALTIGVGRNLDDKGISENEALMLLYNDIDDTVKDLNSGLPWWRDEPMLVQLALANMLFNMGLPRLLTFQNMLAALQAKDYATAYDEALDSKWAGQVGDRAKRVANNFKRTNIQRLSMGL